MASPLRALSRSLELRLLVPLAVTIALVLAVHAMLGYWSARDQISRFVRADLDRSASLIERATHDGMLLNRLREVQTRIERLGSTPGFNAIRIYGKDGRIVLSANAAERETAVDLQDVACTACHAEGQPHGTAVRSHRVLVERRNGHESQRSLSVIRNEPNCSVAGCHVSPEESAVLGVLDVEMTMAPFDQAIGRARQQVAWTTGVLVLASGLVAALFIRRLVHDPVARLHAGTQRIAAGDLETRIEVSGRHELAELASAFNRMVGDLKSARDELGSWSRTLEQKVEQKTQELRKAEKQMTQVETMVSLGKLSATVAHELNNPLSGIVAYARLVRRELADVSMPSEMRSDLDSYLTLIDKESMRCGGIVKNLLVFARGGGVRTATFDIKQIIEHSLMLIRHHLEMNRVELRTVLPERDGVIVADQGQIQQAVLALLMNGIEAMHGISGRELVLTVELIVDDERLQLRISDTGVGIPADLLPHIFEPFVTTKGEGSGVGLGLSVVYGVVSSHHGEIGVHSQPGVGTTFTLSLPRTPNAAPPSGGVPGEPHRELKPEPSMEAAI
jgi:two-component system NtrC family sensor kinase